MSFLQKLLGSESPKRDVGDADERSSCSNCGAAIGGAPAWYLPTLDNLSGASEYRIEDYLAFLRGVSLRGRVDLSHEYSSMLEWSQGELDRRHLPFVVTPIKAWNKTLRQNMVVGESVTIRDPKPSCERCLEQSLKQLADNVHLLQAEVPKLAADRAEFTNQDAYAFLPITDDQLRGLDEFACEYCGGLARVSDARPSAAELLRFAGVDLAGWRDLPNGEPIVAADFQRRGMAFVEATAIVQKLRAVELLTTRGLKAYLPCPECSRNRLMMVAPPMDASDEFPGGVMEVLDNLTGADFEELVARILETKGFAVQRLGRSGDRGIDLVATDANGARWAIQAKRYHGSVPYRALQEIHSGQSLYGANHAVVVSNSTFTAQARRDAPSLGIELWGRDFVVDGLMRLGMKALHETLG